MPFPPQSRLYNFFHVKERIHGRQQNQWPKIFRHNDDFIMSASGYLTPARFICWFYLKWLLLFTFGLGLLASVSFWFFGSHPLTGGIIHALLVIMLLGMIVALLSEQGERFGRLILGKKTVVEFSDHQVVLYKNGYGLSIPKKIPRAHDERITFIIEDHKDRDDRQIGHNSFTRTKYKTYQNAFTVKLLYGDLVEVVADVYDAQMSKYLSTGLELAEAKRAEINMSRAKQVTQLERIPE